MKILIVSLHVKPEYREQFLEAGMVDARGSSETEPGCARFDFMVDEKDPNHFYFYEVYNDDDAFKAHTQTEHFAVYRKMADPQYFSEPTTVVRCANLYPADGKWK